MIWLNRFEEAVWALEEVEGEVLRDPPVLPLKNRLLLKEKKGLALLHLGKISEAEGYFNEGIKLAAGQKETAVDEIRFLNDLAQIEVLKGDTAAAIAKFSQSRQKMESLSKTDLQKVTNNDLGHVYYRVGDIEKAVDLLREDARFFSSFSHHEPYARALYTLAECYRAQKKFGKAVKEYENCIEICQKENLLPILLRAYNGLGNVYLMDQKYPEALKTYQKAIEISIHLKDATTKAALLTNQGVIYHREKNGPQATRRFLLAKQILESRAEPMVYEQQLLIKNLGELAALAIEEKDPMKAVLFHSERTKIIEGSDSLKGEAFEAHLDLAKAYLENRLPEPLASELKVLERLADTADRKKQVEELTGRWKQIGRFDHEKTMTVGG